MDTPASIYRSLIRAARSFPVAPVGRKIEYNCREIFEIYRGETDSEVIRELKEDSAAALRVIGWLKQLPPVGSLSADTCNCMQFSS